MPPKTGEDKKTLILEALNACLRDKPFDRTSIKEIAKAAGVNHGLLHYYFASKEDILVHYIDYVIHHYKSLFPEWLKGPVMAETDRKKRISVFFGFMNDRITLNRDLSRVFIEIWEISIYNPAVKAKLRQAYREWVDILAGMLNRVLADPDVSRRISTAIVAFLEGMALFSIILEPDESEFQKILAGFQEKIVEMI